MANDADMMGLSLARRGAAGRADVPCQYLGAQFHARRSRAPRWCCPAPSSTAPRSTSCSTATRSRCSAGVPTVWLMLLQHLAADRAQAAAPQARRHRRLRLPARHDQDIPGRYGVEVVHAWGMTEMSPLGTVCTMKPEYAGLDRRSPARRAGEAGPLPVHGRDENHRRRGQAPALGRQDLRTAEGARTGGRARLLQGRRATSSTRRASSIPATSPPSTATATCRSPTAPRT